MKYGPRKTAELLSRAASLRSEGLIWREIAKRLGVSYDWLSHHRTKLPEIRLPPVVSDELLDRAQDMRLKNICWKTIATELGYEKWQTIHDALQRRRKKNKSIKRESNGYGCQAYRPEERYIEMWRRGWSCRSIAEIAGVSRATFSRGMAALGFDLLRRPQPIRERAILTAKEMKAKGMSIQKISKIIGYSERNIQRWLE